MELRRIDSLQDQEPRCKSLRDIVWPYIFLQRGQAEAERLKREAARKAGFLLPAEELEKQFWLWAADPDHKESIRRRLFMTKEQKEAAIDEILSSESKYWLADEEYIKSIGGKLGAKPPDRFGRLRIGHGKFVIGN